MKRAFSINICPWLNWITIGTVNDHNQPTSLPDLVLVDEHCGVYFPQRNMNEVASHAIKNHLY